MGRFLAAVDKEVKHAYARWFRGNGRGHLEPVEETAQIVPFILVLGALVPAT